MKHFFLFLLFISVNTFSQNFVAIDKLVKQYPKYSTPEALAAKINADFSSDTHKSRAVFMWLANNIRYDLDEFHNPTQKSIGFRYHSEEEKKQKLQAIKDAIVQKAFSTKQGVCEAYAQSFKKVCDILGLEAEVIKGSVRDSAEEIGNVSNATNHAWNAIKLNKKWIFLDLTWAAGYEINGKWKRNFNDYFYEMPVEKIFQTHYPEEKIWELRIGRISKKTFYNQPIYSHSFLGMNVKLIRPKEGKIVISKDENIVLILKNLSLETSVFYTFKNDQYAQELVVKRKGNIVYLTIPNPKKNTELYLFMNKELALQYKILIE